MTEAWVEKLIEDEMKKLRQMLGAEAFESGHFADAIEIFEQVSFGPEFIDFLTLPAYRRIVCNPPCRSKSALFCCRDSFS